MSSTILRNALMGQFAMLERLMADVVDGKPPTVARIESLCIAIPGSARVLADEMASERHAESERRIAAITARAD